MKKLVDLKCLKDFYCKRNFVWIFFGIVCEFLWSVLILMDTWFLNETLLLKFNNIVFFFRFFILNIRNDETDSFFNNKKMIFPFKIMTSNIDIWIFIKILRSISLKRRTNSYNLYFCSWLLLWMLLKLHIFFL